MKTLQETQDLLNVDDPDKIPVAVKGLLEQLKAQQQLIGLYQEQERLAKQQRFGASSEKLSNQMQLVFNEIEQMSSLKVSEPALEEITYVRTKKQSRRGEVAFEGLEVKRIDYVLEDDECVCPECAGTLHDIGTETRRTIQVVPAQYYVLEEHTHSYACRSCEKNSDHTPILKAPMPQSLIAGSLASASLVSHLITEKYVNATPLYRIEQGLSHKHLKISRQNMSNWVIRVANDWLSPIYDKLHEDLLTRSVLCADETSVQVLQEPNKKAQSKSYEWLYRTGGDTPYPIVLYEYQPSRSQAHPKTFLKGFSGYLHADGYEAYRKIPNITVVGCMAHARRKYAEALAALPEGDRSGSLAFEGLRFYDHLFALEREFMDLSADKRYEKRLKHAKPILDRLHEWSSNNGALPASLLGKANAYTQNQWPYLINYLKDGRLEISNNRAERSIKPFVIGRKSWLFSNTPKGAKASSVIYSLIETAKENGLDPGGYIKFLLEQVPDTQFSELESLLPWGSAVPADLKRKELPSV